DVSSSTADVLRSAETVKAFGVPGGAAFARKRLDDLDAQAKSLGAGGLVWVKLNADGTFNSNAKKLVDDATLAGAKESLGARDGDLILLVAGKRKAVNDVLGTLRGQLARE